MSVHCSSRLLVLAAVFAAPAVFAASPKPDIENGKQNFELQCRICHSIESAVNTNLAPNMIGLLGRKAGTDKNFANYSAALKASGITWSAKTLDEFLLSPPTRVPGTSMPMLIVDPKIRADVIAYLATLKK